MYTLSKLFPGLYLSVDPFKELEPLLAMLNVTEGGVVIIHHNTPDGPIEVTEPQTPVDLVAENSYIILCEDLSVILHPFSEICLADGLDI
jgi:hypothetical protein